MSQEYPNVLIILTDQQRTDTLSCYGSTFTSTPSIDRLAAEGVRFDRAYCANPVCTPSRTSIFTGKMPSKHGAWNIGVNCPESETMLSHILAQRANYRTHYVGKAHFQGFGWRPGGTPAKADESVEAQWDWADRYRTWTGPYYGFQSVELALGHGPVGLAGHFGWWLRDQVGERQVQEWSKLTNLSQVDFAGNAYDWPIPLRFHNSVWTADRTRAFLEQHDPANPFLLVASFQEPHHPHAVPTEFSDRVDPQAVPLPDYTPGELSDKPLHFYEAHTGTIGRSAMRGEYWIAAQQQGYDYRQADEHDVRLGRSYYYTMVRLIDQQVGRILAKLDELRLAEDTIVIMTTDHGELLGDHGIWMKGPFPYEPLIRVPMILRWPRRLRSQSESATRSSPHCSSRRSLVARTMVLPLPAASPTQP